MSNRWQGNRVAVLGYGVEGRSSVNYFVRHGAIVTVHDQLTVEQLPQQPYNVHREQGVEFLLENKAFTHLEDYDVVMRTPTFSPLHPSLARLSVDQVKSQTSLFLEVYRDQTIGITGTKGKGTTASLLHHLLASAGKKAVLGGNIGIPLLDIIDDMTPEHLAVVELSSYQLWDVRTSPHVAIMLAVYPEHLDVHGTLDNYLAAKQNLLRYQHKDDVAIVLTDTPLSRHISNLMPAPQLKVASGWSESGATLEGSEAHIALNDLAYSLALADTSLRGTHNMGNIAAAVIAAHLHGLTTDQVKLALPSFRPLPHRLEEVSTVDSVAFYDDSIATTPEATVAALQSFEEPVVVWLGGVNPSADWRQLRRSFDRGNIAGCVLLGTTAAELERFIVELPDTPPILKNPTDFDQAVQWSFNLLQKNGGAVLLSPGAKSFDQFANYVERGKAFQQAVSRLNPSS